MSLGRSGYFLVHQHRCLIAPQQGLLRRRLLLPPPPPLPPAVWVVRLLCFVVARMPKKLSEPEPNILTWWQQGDEVHEIEAGNAEGCPLREATGRNMMR